MKELEENFIGRGEVRGFIFTQIKKSEYAYVYKVDNGFSVNYEVFFRKENTQFNCISYPSSKAFGIWAWAATKNTYLDKFEELNNRRINALNYENE